MQDREKKLAIALGLVLVVAFALPAFEGWFLQPVTDARNLLTSSQEKVERLTESEGELERAKRNLEEWSYESLPPNPFTAQREYQEWLMDLARMSGFSNPEAILGTVATRGRTYIEIPVTIEARATLEHVARFLYHFERVGLLHRVQTLEMKSPAAIGDPLLDVTVMARGLSLVDAPARSRLFPTTALVDDVDTAGQTLSVDSLAGFPLVDGYQIKIDEELMTVRKRGENELTVERGSEETSAVEHPAGSLVELFPVDRELFQSGHSFEDYVNLLKQNPFTKPAPPVDYKPELAPTTAQIVTRGEPWKLKLQLSGWDPSGGPAVYDFAQQTPPGMTINEQSGELSWDPGKEIEAGQFDVQVVARSNVLSGQQVSLTLPVTLREPNLPPTIKPLGELTAYSGRPLSVSITADDPDGENSALKYSLTGEVPSGATIDAQGKLSWVPPLTLELGEYKLSISVADSGDPQKTTTQEVTVKLEDDAALFTQYTGFFADGSEPEAMLRNLTSGTTSRLSTGDEFSAAEIQATIVGIEPNHLVLQVGENKYRLDLGQNLRQMTLIGPATEPVRIPDSSSES